VERRNRRNSQYHNKKNRYDRDCNVNFNVKVKVKVNGNVLSWHHDYHYYQ